MTGFNCPPHWRPILLSNPGEPIDETLPGFYPAMIKVITKYRCGTIMDVPSVPRPEDNLTPFTARKLRWYDNPALSVYFAIDGFVYDMSGTYTKKMTSPDVPACYCATYLFFPFRRHYPVPTQ